MSSYRKKLIEVALPLDAINRESAREKSIRHGHPSTLHLWWARRPLAACRAVLFSSLVDDPEEPGCPQELLDAIDRLPAPRTPPSGDGTYSERREKLFDLISNLVKWESTTDEAILGPAREIILAATDGNPPPVLDPFCGGGSIPLEAQRLGLEAYASDLNPVAVLITKALIEIPPKFAGTPPVNPEARKGTGSTAAWKGASGLADDVRYYGKRMRDEAWKRIGHLYPKGPKGETIIAWLWARTVKCPNPACGAQMPLVRSFWLSNKKGGEAWVDPVVDRNTKEVKFVVKRGHGSPRNGTVERAVGHCVVCDGVAQASYVRSEADAGRMGAVLEAVVSTAGRGSGRRYDSPSPRHLEALRDAARYVQHLAERPSTPLSLAPEEPARGTFASNAQGGTYGFFRFRDYFNSRQLVTLITFYRLIREIHQSILEHSGGDSPYADAVATYLAFALDRLADRSSTVCSWTVTRDNIRSTFARQAIQMVWDYAEGNPFSESTGNWLGAIDWIARVLDKLPESGSAGSVKQLDAASAIDGVQQPLVFTDPPYYDNVSYSDLSDFFYVWLRRSIGHLYPELFSTLLTPKDPELIAAAYRFGGDKKKAEEHFERGLGLAFSLIRHQGNSSFPVSLYYAFKQEEAGENGATGILSTSTGWETMLIGLLNANFQITGTWPMRTELGTRMVSLGTNALASSIVIACRPRPEDAPLATRREFLSALRRELPGQLKVLMSGRVAPVDLLQAAIGPGMAVFSRYSKVLEADGSPMTIRTALQEINYVIEDYLAQQEGDLDVESQFCVNWYAEFGANWGEYGRAETLVTAKNLSVEGLQRRDLVEAARGRVRLKLRGDFQEDWDPAQQGRVSTWEACQRLVWTLMNNNLGEPEAGRLARRLGDLAEQARDLAFRLYGIADHKKWADEALGYNALVASWPEIQKHAAAAAQDTQGRMV